MTRLEPSLEIQQRVLKLTRKDMPVGAIKDVVDYRLAKDLPADALVSITVMEVTNIRPS